MGVLIPLYLKLNMPLKKYNTFNNKYILLEVYIWPNNGLLETVIISKINDLSECRVSNETGLQNRP